MEDTSENFLRAFKSLQGDHNNRNIALEINVICLEGILEKERETRRLISDLKFVTSAITCTVIEGWKSVRAVVNELYDRNAIQDAVNRAPKNSRFYNNQKEVVRLRQCLEHWWSEYLYNPPDSINKVVGAIAQKKAENISFLQNYKH